MMAPDRQVLVPHVVLLLLFLLTLFFLSLLLLFLFIVIIVVVVIVVIIIFIILNNLLTGEASKQIHEYKLKLQKAEQEITNLDGTVSKNKYTFITFLINP